MSVVRMVFGTRFVPQIIFCIGHHATCIVSDVFWPLEAEKKLVIVTN